MHICVYIYKYMCTCTYKHVCIYMYTYVYMYICIYINIYATNDMYLKHITGSALNDTIVNLEVAKVMDIKGNY